MSDTEDSEACLPTGAGDIWVKNQFPEMVVTSKGSKKQSSVADLKAPWVPAPAKTSSQTNIIFNRKTRYALPVPGQTCESTHELKISDVGVPTPQTSSSSFSDAGFLVQNPPPPKKSSSHTMSRHKLQSKDSFVDVTTCLARKRHRIMKIWEENIASEDTELIERLERANKYGQDAAVHLEKLKLASQEPGKKGAKDAGGIDTLRELVMSSLKKFEDENKVIQAMLSSRPAEDSVPPKCVQEAEGGSNLDLSQLNQIYSEKFSLADANPLNPFSHPSEDTKKLEEKLTEQQEMMKSLESELKRIDSQCSFDVHLLKSKLKETVEELSGLPEMLHVTEMKLAQCMSRVAVLQKTVQDKENENKRLVSELNSNKSKVETLTEKLRVAECENSLLHGRIKELESLSLAFKKDSSSTDDIIKTIESKLEMFRNEGTTSRIHELEEKLRLAKKHIQQQKRAKEDATSRLTRRVEELMEALDESRQKNHILRNQLHFIRTSYHNLFPPNDIFGFEDHQQHEQQQQSIDPPKFD